jgi:hypothetical protein
MSEGKLLPDSSLRNEAATGRLSVTLPLSGETAKLEIVPLTVFVVKAIVPLPVTASHVEQVNAGRPCGLKPMSSPSLGQSNSSDSQSMQALVAEVRQLRKDLQMTNG